MADEMLSLKEIFYDKLLEAIREKRKLTKNSIILTFLRTSSNDIMGYLDKAGVEGTEVSRETVQILIAKNYVRGGEDFSRYLITARGVWEIEEHLGYISTKILVNEIDEWKFRVKGIGEKLKPQEKVTALALIALRCFCEETPLNRNNRDALDKLLDVLTESKELLLSMNRTSSFEFTKPSNEHPIEAIFRRTNELKKRTRGIYCFGGKKHWFDIYNSDTEEISTDKLSYLLWKIFGGDLTIDDQNKISTFCDEILNKYKNYVYNVDEREKFVFSNIKYKNVIKDALFEIIINQTKWEGIDSVA